MSRRLPTPSAVYFARASVRPDDAGRTRGFPYG
jgi:hypothetical protein